MSSLAIIEAMRLEYWNTCNRTLTNLSTLPTSLIPIKENKDLAALGFNKSLKVLFQYIGNCDQDPHGALEIFIL